MRYLIGPILIIRHDHPVGSICKDVSTSRAIVPVYGQSPFGEEQQQTNILDFQTADVKLDSITYPNENAVLSMAADKDVFKLSVTIAPTKDGKLTLMIPRNLTDSKVAGEKTGNL